MLRIAKEKRYFASYVYKAKSRLSHERWKSSGKVSTFEFSIIFKNLVHVNEILLLNFKSLCS